MVFDASPLSSENVLRDVHDPINQRLRVDSTVTAVVETVEVHVEIDSTDGDSVLVVGTEDGTPTGIQHVLKVGSDLNLRVKDESANTTLTTIDSDLNAFASQNHTDLLSIKSDIDSTNTKLDTVNSHLINIEGYTDDLEGLVTASNIQLTAINANTDTLESLVTSTNTKLDTANVHLTNLESYVDGLEGLVTSSNVQLSAINSNTDGLETLITTSNTQLSAINANTDTIETLITSTNTKLDTANTHLTNLEGFTDGLEGLITASNVQLTAINANTDTVETLITSTNTKLDTVNTNLTNIQTEIDSSQYTINEAFNKATAIAGQLDDTSTTAATENNIAPVRITTQRAFHTNLRDNTGTEISTTTINSKNRLDVNVPSAGQTGAAVPFHAQYIGAQDPSVNLQALRIDANNDLKVVAKIQDTSGSSITLGRKSRALSIPVVEAIKPATYSAAFTALTAVALATDIFTITGSATKTIRILRMYIVPTQTTAAYNIINVVKRSTANTAGTSTTRTAVPHDSTDAAATATIRTYTANPTLGTSIGNVRSQRGLIPATAPGGNISTSPIYGYSFGDSSDGQAIILRGIAEVLSINFNAATITGNSIDGYIEWTEE